MSKSENSKNWQFGKIKELAIWKVQKTCILDNSKNFQFGKFRKFLIRKIPKNFNLDN